MIPVMNCYAQTFEAVSMNRLFTRTPLGDGLIWFRGYFINWRVALCKFTRYMIVILQISALEMEMKLPGSIHLIVPGVRIC